MGKGTIAGILTSPKLAVTLLVFITLYAGIATWFPWSGDPTIQPPSWAVLSGLDHPFNSLPFIIPVMLLFINTLACTIKRFGHTIRLMRGELPKHSLSFTVKNRFMAEELLRSERFSPKGSLFIRRKPALWGGFILHVGIVLLILGITVQQGFHDSGAFQIAEGESLRLDAAPGLFNVSRGVFAPGKPPALQVALEKYDPFLHQKGYAPDRISRLLVKDLNTGEERVVNLDRASGVKVGACYIYQAIPTGYALKAALNNAGEQAFHLRRIDDRHAAGEFTSPGGENVRFILEAEHSLVDPRGTGALRVNMETPRGTLRLDPGSSFPFGLVEARAVGIVRWGGFTYARSPGIAGVFTGFAVILAGSLLLLFPAGTARIDETGATAVVTVYLTRGREEFLPDIGISRADDTPDKGEA